MLSLFNFLKSLFARSQARNTSPADEDYLSGAVDIYDLERRMREIDSRSRPGLRAFAPGLFPF